MPFFRLTDLVTLNVFIILIASDVAIAPIDTFHRLLDCLDYLNSPDCLFLIAIVFFVSIGLLVDGPPTRNRCQDKGRANFKMSK